MAPFNTPEAVVSGIKEKIDSLLVQGGPSRPINRELGANRASQRIACILEVLLEICTFIAQAVGKVTLYRVLLKLRLSPPSTGSPNDSTSQLAGFELEEVRKGVARRAIEQLGFLKDINSLIVLSGASTPWSLNGRR